MAKIINGSTIYLALADYLATNAYINDTAQDVLVMVAKWIDEAPEVNGWIPVTDRLPELFEDCFVLVKMKYDWEKEYEYNVDAGCYVGEHGYIDCFNTYNDWNEGQTDIHVTHWMPLPEPPKEVE